MPERERKPFYGYDEEEQDDLRRALYAALGLYEGIAATRVYFGIDSEGSEFAEELKLLRSTHQAVVRKRSQ